MLDHAIGSRLATLAVILVVVVDRGVAGRVASVRGDVATTHSPDLVDELAPEEVVVMGLREDGTTAARPLTECPRSDMLGVLRSGQLWSAVGEAWVTEAKEPQP